MKAATAPLARRLSDLERLPLDMKRVETVSSRLSQKERSLIFLALVDHPSMLFGDLGRVLANIRGVIEPDGEPNQRNAWETSRPYVLRDRARDAYVASPEQYEKSLRGVQLPGYMKDKLKYQGSVFASRVSTTAEEIFSILDAVSRAEPGQKSVRFFSESARAVVEIPISADVDYADQIRRHGYNGLATSAFRGARENPLTIHLEQFKSFFEWLHKDPERVEYAKIVIEQSADAIFKTFVFASDARAREVKNAYRGNTARAAIVGGSRQALVPLPALKADQRLLQSIKRTKVEIGERVHAFSTDGRADVETAEPQGPHYQPMGPSMRQTYAVKLKDVHVYLLVFESPTVLVESSRTVRLALTSMAANLSEMAETVSRVDADSRAALAGNHVFYDGRDQSKIDKTVAAVENVTGDLALIETDIEQIADVVLETQSTLREALKHLEAVPSADRTPAVNAEIQTIEVFLPQIEAIQNSKLESARQMVADIRARIDQAQLEILQTLK